MGFEFRLETLLKNRKREEENARKVYVKAQLAVDQSLKKIDSLWRDIDTTRKNMENEQVAGGKKSEYLAGLDEFIKGCKIRIEKEKICLRELSMIAEEKREIFIEAVKEFKILEKIKEKKAKEYKIEKTKRETKEIDNLVTTRYKRGE